MIVSIEHQSLKHKIKLEMMEDWRKLLDKVNWNKIKKLLKKH